MIPLSKICVKTLSVELNFSYTGWNVNPGKHVNPDKIAFLLTGATTWHVTWWWVYQNIVHRVAELLVTVWTGGRSCGGASEQECNFVRVSMLSELACLSGLACQPWRPDKEITIPSFRRKKTTVVENCLSPKIFSYYRGCAYSAHLWKIKIGAFFKNSPIISHFFRKNVKTWKNRCEKRTMCWIGVCGIWQPLYL